MLINLLISQHLGWYLLMSTGNASTHLILCSLSMSRMPAAKIYVNFFAGASNFQFNAQRSALVLGHELVENKHKRLL